MSVTARVLGLTFIFGLTAVFARDAQEGVKADKMTPLRNPVPETQFEAAAMQQYAGIKQQAQRQGALAPDDHPQARRLRAIANRLIPHTACWNERAAQWQWEVNLIGSREINAFCMPGGKIAFFSGLLNKLKLTDDEAAIVMGHEIAHALREHGRGRAAKSDLADAGARIAGIGLSALFGIHPDLTAVATDGFANLTLLKFSRDDETEADLVGLDIVARAGYDPRAGIALWQKMEMISNSAPPQWLSTHPAGRTRIAEMQKYLPQLLPLFAKAKGLQLAALPPYQSNLAGLAAIS